MVIAFLKHVKDLWMYFDPGTSIFTSRASIFCRKCIIIVGLIWPLRGWGPSKHNHNHTIQKPLKKLNSHQDHFNKHMNSYPARAPWNPGPGLKTHMKSSQKTYPTHTSSQSRLEDTYKNTLYPMRNTDSLSKLCDIVKNMTAERLVQHVCI